jgi:hypothetical protein
MPFTDEDIEDLFTYHKPVADQPERYQAIRDAAKQFAYVLIRCTKPSADQTTSIRHLRDCVMTANASIALEGGQGVQQQHGEVMPGRNQDTSRTQIVR